MGIARTHWESLEIARNHYESLGIARTRWDSLEISPTIGTSDDLATFMVANLKWQGGGGATP